MAIEAGGLYVSIGADLKGLNESVEKAKAKFKGLGEAGQKLQKVGLAFGAFGGAVVGAFGAAFNSFTKAGDALQKMSLRTGIAVESLQELGYVAKLSDTSLEEMQSSVKKLQTGITEASEGNAKYASTFEKIGLDINDLKKLNPEEQFMKTAAAIAEIENPTERAARAVALFGKSGVSLLPMLSQGAEGVDKLRQEAHKFNHTISSKTADMAAEFQDSLTSIYSAIKGIGAAIMEVFLPMMLKVADCVKSVAAAVKLFIEENPKLVKAVGYPILAIGALSAAFGGLIGSIGSLVRLIPVLSAGWAAIASPIGVTVIAIGGLVSAIVLLYSNWDKVMRFMAETFSKVKIVVVSSISQILQGLVSVFGNMPVIGNKLKQALSLINRQIEAENLSASERSLKYKQEQLDKEKTAFVKASNSKISVIKQEVKEEKEYYEKLLDFQINAGEKTLQDKINFLNRELSAVQKGTKAEIEVRQSILETQKKINDERSKLADSQAAYEKAQLEKRSVSEKKDWHTQELARWEARLAAATVGSEAYYEILGKMTEESKSLLDLSNANMVRGFSNALEELSVKALNFKDFFNDVFKSLTSAVSDTLMAAIDNMGKGWKGFTDAMAKITDTLKNAIIKSIVDMAAQWIVQRTAMFIKEQLFAKKEIASAAAVAAAKASAASAWSLWGAIGIGAAIGAGVTAMAMAIAGKFENGGIVGGNSFNGDNMIARVNSGEMILNKRQQAKLWGIVNGDSGNTKSSSIGSTVNINQNIEVSTNSGSLSDLTEAIRRGTVEALEFAGLSYKVGAKQAGVAI
jgi:hypothetical protein